MMVSPPGSPDGNRTRSVAMPATNSPDPVQKQRPTSTVQRHIRSNSRMSQTSSRAGTRLSDEDAKTSVKVVVRVRPPLGPDDPGFDLIPQRFQKSMVQVNTNTSLAVESPQGRKVFIFDRVFGSDTTQKGLWDYLEDSVESFLQGYNVSILAYGQSGSGKSFTMGTSGPAQQFDPSSKGVIPRAATHLFETLDTSSSTSNHTRQGSGLKTPNRYSAANLGLIMANSKMGQGSEKDWDMSVTYVEIYNEQPRDLLLPEAQPQHERPTVQIREDTKGRILVEGLKSVSVNSIEELMAVLNHGSSIRQTDATAINSKSSRSHAIFTIILRQSKPAGSNAQGKDKRGSVPVDAVQVADGFVTVESKLHFVDLAGSERLKNTGATGERAKEGISINAGLASLGKVISQLSSRSSGGHVSYRDSKLTRILQDSLGGNAITYMVACVTPAEFHLSETLNTVQYAQRARNIQSKPKIQHVNEDADKQAVIDRLKTEVAFLRQQIRSAEGGERKTGLTTDRSNDRELELQNQLLDVQESYQALSQRHAKLISDLAQSSEMAQPPSEAPSGDSAVDRLKRSQANQQQIEQVVLEYEKTIQSLESNLQTTRSSLANTESNLMEKETKCAYVETMNQQLNTRIQKLMDRESNTETYLRDLEARLEDQGSGSEKQNAIVSELRKEMSRIRESESNAEDYICTLEERLAEADQDMEIMQREVDRLEQLVARQRSLGKLDNLLYELDQNEQNAKQEEEVKTPRAETSTANGMHSRQESKELLEALPEHEELDTNHTHDVTESDAAEQLSEADTSELQATQTAKNLTAADQEEHNKEEEGEKEGQEEPQPSPAQQKYIADQFESVSQELFDLKIEHESTINELDLIQAKYQEALHALAKMQDSFDDARDIPSRSISSVEPDSRPASYLEDARVQELKNGEQRHSSRSLSSELSSIGELVTPMDQAEPTTVTKDVAGPTKITFAKGIPNSTVDSQEVGRLQVIIEDHEKNLTTMSEQYSQLQLDHTDTLKTLDKLKSEIQRTRQDRPASPSVPGVIRRMTSNVASGIDRGQRSIVSLRSLLAEELDEKPDKMESAEVHLSAATQEMQNRGERVQALELELKNVRKEMDMKSTIISGLTRERNSIKAGAGTPVDLSMVSQMRDQLIQKETELKSLHEGYAMREHELQQEVARLSAENKSRNTTPDPAAAEREDEIRNLKEQLIDISKQREDARQNVDETKKMLTVTTAELGIAKANLENLRAQQTSPTSERTASRSSTDAPRNIPVAGELNSHEEAIIHLKRQLEEEISANAEKAQKVSQLTADHAAVTKDIVEHKRAIEAKSSEIDEHKDKIANLEQQILEAKAATELHRHGLKSLHESHANEIEEMKLSHAGLLAAYDDKLTELTAAQEKRNSASVAEAESTKKALDNLIKNAGTIMGHSTSHDMLINHIQDIIDEKRHIIQTNSRLVLANAELEKQLTGRQTLEELEQSVEEATQKVANYQETIRSLANEVANHEETIRANKKTITNHESTIEVLETENQKKVHLIEELEQQLQNSFEQHHNRVSVIQAQGNQALVEAQNRIASLEKEVQRSSMAGSDEAGSRTNTMKSQVPPQSPPLEQRSNSMTSGLRKSGSIASLPSPPPAIPLPPLPTLPGISIVQSSNPSPPQSRHTSKEVAPPATPNSVTSPRDSHTIRRQSAIIEDQEGRLRTMEKHLHAEKQLTATLEEALVDLETQSNKLRADAESWKKKAWATEEELAGVRKERRSERLSVQAVEEEVKKRREAEAARAQLEERMRLLQQGDGKKKKKAGGLNCF